MSSHPQLRTVPPASRREAGFTLIEALIALVIAVVVIVAALDLFDFNRRLSRVEIHQTEMQQAVRAVHLEVASRIRVAGRGGALQGTAQKRWPDQGVVVEVASNVQGAARQVAPAAADPPEAVAGTDVLTLRGVMTGPIYYGFDNSEGRTYLVLRDGSGATAGDPAQVRAGEVHLCAVSPTGFAQPIEPLRAAIDSGSEEALLLAGTGGDGAYAVVKLDPSTSATTSAVCNPLDPSAGVRIGFVVSGDGGRADRYSQLGPGGPGFPPGLTSVAYAGLLEEYRYYVREVREDPNDASSPLMPRLSRARLYPNTGEPWGTDAATRAESVATDVADDVLDFQVSLGFDSAQGGGALEDGTLPEDGEPVFESADGDGDDWLFNGPDDDPRDPVWARPGSAVLTQPWLRARLFYVRLSTVGRAAYPIPQYEAPELQRLADRVYDPGEADDPDSSLQRKYRRWLLTTTVDLRNL